MAERMRAHLVLETGAARMALHDLVEALAREPGAAPVEEQARLAPARSLQRAPAPAVGAQRPHGLAADRHDALL